MENRISIFIACHKPTFVPKNPLLQPVQAGAALTDWRGAGMVPDNIGDHISEKNRTYCELTVQYWAWKNRDCRYYGFFHYRRYLSFEHLYPVDQEGNLKVKRVPCPYIELDDVREDLSRYHLEPVWMKQQIEEYDLITVLREKLDTTVYGQYCQYHAQNDLDLALEIMGEYYPEYKQAAEQYMSSREIYYMNMYIMRKELFQSYMKWLFDILTEFERRKKGEKDAQPRLMGYLAERMFGIFYTYQRGKGAVCAETPYLKFYNTEVGERTEKTDYIRSFRLKPTKYEIKINMRRLNKLFPAGSRRRILLRSIFLR